MKNLFSAICITALIVCVSSPAFSYSVGLNDVGAVDSLVAWGSPNSGDQNEINWVNQKLGTSYTTADLTKYPSNSIPMVWQETDVSGIYALAFQTIPEYFYIKTGNGNIITGEYEGYNHFLFKNDAALGWAVVDLGALGIEINNIEAFSHIGEVGETQAPEPAGLLLLGLGLIGVVGIGRKIK